MESQNPIGYLVYCSAVLEPPEPLWLNTTPEPTTKKKFSDPTVLPGEASYYYVVPVYGDGTTGSLAAVITLRTDEEQDEWPDVIEQ